METVKIRRAGLRPQIVVVCREQNDARAVGGHVIDVLGEDVLPVALEALSQTSAEGKGQGIPSQEPRGFNLLDIEEIRIWADVRTGGQGRIDITKKEDVDAMKMRVLQREPCAALYLLFNARTQLQQVGGTGKG